MSDNKKNDGLVHVGKALTKEEELNILLSGSVSLEDFYENFQFLTFVLDDSGSMDNTLSERGLTKRALQQKVVKKYAAEKLTNTSGMKIGVIGFSTTAHVLVEGSSDANDVRNAVDQLYCSGGSTYMAKGLQRAITIMRRASKDYIPRIIVTSDGWVHDNRECERLADEAKAAGIIIDTIFIGTDPTDPGADFMRKLAARAGGVSEHIQSEAEFEQKFLGVAERPLLAAKNGS